MARPKLPPPTFKRYIPQLLKETLDLVSYPRKENLYVIIDRIYSRNQYFKSPTQKLYGYSEIPMCVFKKLLPTSNHLIEDMNFLIDNKFIIRNEWYNYLQGKSKGYKIAEEYLSKTVGIVIQNPKINKRIKDGKDSMREKTVKNLAFQKSKYYKTFNIKYAEAMSFINEKVRKEIRSLAVSHQILVSPQSIEQLINGNGHHKFIRGQFTEANGKNELNNIIHRYISNEIQINRIKDGFLYFKRNKTNGRLDTNLTCLASCLRPFLVSKSDLYSIDLKNSQPFFLYTILKDEEGIDSAELARYKELVVWSSTPNSVGLYEWLMAAYEVYSGTTTTREKMKSFVFKVFYSKNASFSHEKSFFSNLFPSISQWMTQVKEKDYKRLAIQLQSIESHIILDVIMPALLCQNILPYTIHDSFVCEQDEVQIIMDTVYSILEDFYGCKPNLHKDCISNLIEEDENMIEDFEAFLIELNQDDSW